MRVSVLVPSEEYRSYAGARIRYGRLRPRLAELGLNLDFADVDDFAPNRAKCDVLLISKCHDARSLIAASALSERGCLVGVDLFDDYFSQRADSRLTRYRNWLKQLLPVCGFALCSTPSMARVISRYREGLPVHVVKDPAEDLRLDHLSSALAAKMARVLDERKIRLAWFGVGDNPHFRVGLGDLSAFGGILRQLQRNGMGVELTVLTNGRALNANGLSLVGRLPIHTTVDEWTESRECEILADAFACFLPVNSQPFGTAKSLNRAVTALSAGCQVLSAGYPLYEPLDDLIYRDVETFLTDVGRGRMRFSANTLDNFQDSMEAHASAAEGALSLVQFLERLVPSVNERAAPLGLIHGHATSEAADKLIRSLHGFSVGSPYCTADLEFDVIFQSEPGRLVMFVSETSTGRLTPASRGRLGKSSRIFERKFRELPGDEQTADCPRGSQARLPLSFQLATYRSTMEVIRNRMDGAFGPCRYIISEDSPVPFEAASPC